MNWRKNSTIWGAIAFGILILQGCGPSRTYVTQSSSSSDPGTECRNLAQGHADPSQKNNFNNIEFGEQEGPSVFAGAKVQLMQSLEFESQDNGLTWHAPFHSLAYRSSGDDGKFISKAREIAIVVDRYCVSTQSLGQQSELVRGLDLNRLRRDFRSSRAQTFIVKAPRRFDLAEFRKIVENDPCIYGVGDSIQFRLSATPNDPHFAQQRQYPSIGATTAWDTFFHTTHGIRREVVIAVIDGGVTTSHVDLSGHLWINSDEIAANGVDDDGNGYVDDVNSYNFVDRSPASEVPHSGPVKDDPNLHATHVSGLATAAMNNSVGISGVMGRSVRLMSLNVFGSGEGAEVDNIDEAIRYAADNGADVINMSFGGQGPSPSTYQALTYAASKGVVLVAAAGNETMNIDRMMYSPAGYGKSINGMLTVGAVNTGNLNLANFSNYGVQTVEIAAPGMGGILSTVPGNQYGSLDGTSMASPIVAGAAGLAYGLVWSRTGTRPTAAFIEQILLTSALKKSNLTRTIKDGNYLDLAGLATTIDAQYPAGSRNPGPGSSSCK